MFKRHAAAIYFRTTRAEEMKRIVKKFKTGELKREEAEKKLETRDIEAIENFIEAGEGAESQRTMFITITPNTVFFYKPKGRVSDMREEEQRKYDKDLSKLAKTNREQRLLINAMKTIPERGKVKKHIPKYMPVEIIKENKVKDVPHVLATLPCNQWYVRGTCREIKDYGVKQAINCRLGRQIDIPESAQQLMRLLSPYELETLVFLILKREGLFVPAWRGGTLKGIDIIARNLNDYEIKIDPITFKPRESFTFQVKRCEVKEHGGPADWTIAIDSEREDNRVLTAEWLIEQLRKPGQRDTREWLENSLRWVPNINSLISII